MGCGAAVLWACAGLLSAPAARIAGPARAFLWTSTSGVVIALAVALLTGLPSGDASDWALVGVAGVAYAAGTGLWMLAVSAGRVSIVVPIVACDGAIAALLAITTGTVLPAAVWFGLAAMASGIVLVTTSGGDETSEELAFGAGRARPLTRTVAMAGGAAVMFGVVFFASGQATSIEPIWVVAITRCVQLVVAAPVCLALGQVSFPSEAWRQVLAYGFVDAGAYMLYVTAAGHNLAVASVAASQYAALTAVGAVLLFKERLARLQLAGIGIVLASIAFIAAQA
jgi:drug/metabolite transporter (DMT)-like permease